jgi:SAM-dependent methyltransferase
MWPAHAMTGTWIVDVAKHVPTGVTLYGIDIDSRMFPSPVPSNIHLSLASVVNLPSDWTNSFNLVNQRLLIAGLTSGQWVDALNELHRVLVPGGRVQMCEAGDYRAGPATKNIHKLIDALAGSRGLVSVVDCAPRIPALLKAAGFVDITTEKRQILLGGSVGVDGRKNLTIMFRFVFLYWHHPHCVNWPDLRGKKTPILKAGGFGFISSEKEFDELVDSVEAEFEANMDASQDFFVFTARKDNTAWWMGGTIDITIGQWIVLLWFA